MHREPSWPGLLSFFPLFLTLFFVLAQVCISNRNVGRRAIRGHTRRRGGTVYDPNSREFDLSKIQSPFNFVTSSLSH